MISRCFLLLLAVLAYLSITEPLWASVGFPAHGAAAPVGKSASIIMIAQAPAQPAAKVRRSPSGESRLKMEMLEKEKEKLEKEIKKLTAEIAELNAVTPWISKWATIFGALGGLAGALAVFFVARVGARVNRDLNTAQGDKLRQEEHLARDRHTIELFEILGRDNIRAQMAAASMLIERLRILWSELHPANPNGARPSGDRAHAKRRERELATVAQALVAVTKEHRNAPEVKKEPTTDSSPPQSTHPRLVKLIADNLVDAILARVPAPEGKRDKDDTLDPNVRSTLKELKLDFQWARLTDANWSRVNARGVDFYEADLQEASLREAYLEDAVFVDAHLRNTKFLGATLRNANLKRADLSGAKIGPTPSRYREHDPVADLSGATLEEAKLIDADLRKAKLAGADLRQADLSGANLHDATFDTKTRWPEGFDPSKAGARPVASDAAPEGQHQ